MGLLSRLFGFKSGHNREKPINEDLRNEGIFTDEEIMVIRDLLYDARSKLFDPSFKPEEYYYWPPAFSKWCICAPDIMIGMCRKAEEDVKAHILEYKTNSPKIYYYKIIGYRLSADIYRNIGGYDELEKFDKFFEVVTEIDTLGAIMLMKEKQIAFFDPII